MFDNCFRCTLAECKHINTATIIAIILTASITAITTRRAVNPHISRAATVTAITALQSSLAIAHKH